MNITQERIQVIEPLSSLLTNQSETENSNSAVSALAAPIESSENRFENELRSPLREISDNTMDCSEQPDQEQDSKQQENSEDGLENINEYVAMILEKLEKQKQKTAKALEAKENSQQIQELANAFIEIANEDAENRDVDISSKENMSPVKTRLTVSGKTASVSSSPVKEALKYKLDEVLHISKHEISYGHKFPGQIAEEHLDIVNKSDHDFVVRIEVDCLNEELQDTEEYVYSVRRSHLQEYNDRHYLIMAPYSCASFKFALKVPNIMRKGEIEGQVRISIEDVPGMYTLEMNTKVCVPKVFCPKELRLQGLNYSVIKLAVKDGKKQDFKLPIKNNGPVPVTMEMEFFEPKDEVDGDEKQMLFDCLAHPSVLTVPANGSAQLNVVVKPWKSITKTKTLEKNKPIRKILLGKVRDSSVVYSFVFGIEFY